MYARNFVLMALLSCSTLKANIHLNLSLLRAALQTLALEIEDDLEWLEAIVIELNKETKTVEDEVFDNLINPYPVHPEIKLAVNNFSHPKTQITEQAHREYKEGLLEIARYHILPYLRGTGSVLTGIAGLHRQAVRAGKNSVAAFIEENLDVVYPGDHRRDKKKFREMLEFIVDHISTNELPPELLYFERYAQDLKQVLFTPPAILVPTENVREITQQQEERARNSSFTAVYVGTSPNKIGRRAFFDTGSLATTQGTPLYFIPNSNSWPIALQGRGQLSFSPPCFASDGDRLISYAHTHIPEERRIIIYNLAVPEHTISVYSLPELVVGDVIMLASDPIVPGCIWFGTDMGELWAAVPNTDGTLGYYMKHQSFLGSFVRVFSLRWEAHNRSKNLSNLYVSVSKIDPNNGRRVAEERCFIAIRSGLSLNQLFFLHTLAQFRTKEGYDFGEYKQLVRRGIENFKLTDDVNISEELLGVYGLVATKQQLPYASYQMADPDTFVPYQHRLHSDAVAERKKALAEVIATLVPPTKPNVDEWLTFMREVLNHENSYFKQGILDEVVSYLDDQRNKLGISRFALLREAAKKTEKDSSYQPVVEALKALADGQSYVPVISQEVKGLDEDDE